MSLRDYNQNREGEFPPEGWEGTVLVMQCEAGKTKANRS